MDTMTPKGAGLLDERSGLLKVVIVDDEKFIRRALRVYLGQAADIEVLAEGESGEDAVQLARTHQPDVLLMDLQMPGMDGIEATRRILEASPDARILVVTGHVAASFLMPALLAGASGYVVKDAEPEEIVAAVREVHGGGCPIDPSVAHQLVDEVRNSARRTSRAAAAVELTARESDVLKLLCQGRSNREIAGSLYLSEPTVKFHLTRLMRKFAARDRVQLVVAALSSKSVD